MVDAYQLEDYSLVEDLTIEIGCNWNVTVDANSEYYHIRTVHPELVWLYDVARETGRSVTVARPAHAAE